jgi:CRP/FNR family transcriptional regulator, cyclic AMP receptor protein
MQDFLQLPDFFRSLSPRLVCNMATDAGLLEQMSVNPWFASLPLSERQTMLSESEVVRLSPGERLFRRGDAPTTFCGLVNGRLKASTLREDGKEAILVLLEPGNWFGQASLLNGLTRSHDITALEPAEVLTIKATVFEILMQRYTFVRAIAVLESIHTNLLYQMIEDATLHSTRARVARRLLRLAYGDLTMAVDSRADIAVSQDVLAMMLGITRQTLALELKEMAARGAVALRYGRIEIVSTKILKTFEAYE